MFKIKDLKDNIIDLNGLKEFEKEFEIISINTKNDKKIPFYIDLVSTPNIKVSVFNDNSIKITINVVEILEEEFIIFRNAQQEKLTITIIPNAYFLDEIQYKFKITKSEITKDGILKLKILSKGNGTEVGWKCVYDGKPISYCITPMESNKSEYVYIKLAMEMISDFTSKLIFEQNESGEKVEFEINNTPNGMKLIEK